MEMGYPVRVVLGRVGSVGYPHAWVQFIDNGRTYILEPLMPFIGVRFPRLSAIRNKPLFSITWNGEKMEEYLHEEKNYEPSVKEAAQLFGEWLFFWGTFWLKNCWRIPVVLVRLPFRIYARSRGAVRCKR